MTREGLTAPEGGYLHCPLRDCSWRTVDRSHLGWVVVGVPAADEHLTGTGRSSGVDLKRVPALEQMHGELLEHLRTDHLQELQLMLAGASGGRGTPVQAGITQHLTAEAMRGAEDTVLAVVVPKMRAQLAGQLAKKKLRPLDPWPAVQVRKLCWAAMDVEHDGAPGGMRPARDGEEPDLWQLELRTDAVPDTRTLEL